MKSTLHLLLVLCFLSPAVSLAQNNYVVRVTNAASPGEDNTIIGPLAGNTTMTGTNNVFLGTQAGNANTSGGYNVFSGTQAGNKNLGGFFNVFTGAAAGQNNTGGDGNNFIGFAAGQSNTTGNENASLGDQAGRSNETGNYNLSLGSGAGYYNKSSSYNTFVGSLAGFKSTAGPNTFLGGSAGYSNQTGTQNTFVGYEAGYFNTASANTFMGYQAGRSTTSGTANVFIGSAAGYANAIGTGNLFLGQQAGYNSTGSYNLFMGNGSGSSNTTGQGNTAIGDGSLLNNNIGQRNTAIGQYAGVNSKGDYNTFIGFASDVASGNTGITNAVAIGPYAQVGQSNSIVLGATNANVGIGVTAPTAKLHIATGMNGTSGLRLQNLTSNNTASVTNQNKFLSVDGSGNVILVSSNGSAREGAVDALWQRKGSFLQSTNGESIIIGQGVDKTPADYNLFVSKGILTEKVKVAVKNTSDWSDKVFDTGYQLKSLDEVGKYIQANKHLPGVPSAKEMVEKGNDLHKTDAKLLEKIEELTLYSIQLEKTTKQQESRLRQQQADMDELKQLVRKLIDRK